NPENAQHPGQLATMRAAAEALGLALLPLEVRSASDVRAALGATRGAGAGALVGLEDLLLWYTIPSIVDTAKRTRLPTMFDVPDFVDRGGLVAYRADIEATTRRAAAYVDKILKGARPAELPVEQPTKFTLVLNLKLAQEIGVTVPDSVLVQATRVFRSAPSGP